MTFKVIRTKRLNFLHRRYTAELGETIEAMFMWEQLQEEQAVLPCMSDCCFERSPLAAALQMN